MGRGPTGLPGIRYQPDLMSLSGQARRGKRRCGRLAQDFATRWLWNYNHARPNMTLGGITPKQKLALAT